MNTTRPPAKTISPSLVAPAKASALCAALYATFTAGSALSAPVAVNIVPDVTLGMGDTFILDINGDSIPEYTFQRSFSVDVFEDIVTTTDRTVVNTFANEVLGFVVTPAGAVNGEGKPGTYASALAAGDSIGFNPSAYVSGPDVILAGKNTINFVIPFTYGQFYDSALAYVGLQFDIPGGSIHYGWVEVTGDNQVLTLTRYGYECDAETAIAAGAGTEGAVCAAQQVPEPGSLALLIAGAVGVLALRRRQRAAA